MKTPSTLKVYTLKNYNEFVTHPCDILTGKEYRRKRRKEKRKNN